MKSKLLSMMTASAFIFSVGISSNAMAAGKAVTLKISANDQMKFDKSELTVPADSQVTVELENKGGALQHNWVLTLPGKAMAVANESVSAGPSQNYLKKGPNVIANTKLADPHKKVKVTFKAPKKGTYDYICTFPGHGVMMKGKFVVK